MEKIGNFGLIFIRKEDPIGKLTSSITKQKYTIIGFYFKTTIDGHEDYKTIYYDIYGFSNLNCKLYKTYNEMQNLSDIIKNPLVSSIAVKPLNAIYKDCPILKCESDCESSSPLEHNSESSLTQGVKTVDIEKTIDLEESLKLAMIKFSNDGSEKSIREWIYEMFGYPIVYHTKGNTSIEYINKIMKEVDLYCKIKQNTSLDPIEIAKINNKEPICKDSEGKLEVFEVFGSGFTQSTDDVDKLIQAYLYDTNVFGEVIELKLPNHTKLETELESEISIKQHKELLQKFGYNLMEMITDDPKFCEVVIGGINKTRHNNCENSSIKLFSPFVIDLMKNNGKSFIGIAETNDVGIPIFEMKLQNVFGNMLLYGNFESNDFNCNDRVIIYKKSGNFLHAFRNMYCQIKSLSEKQLPEEQCIDISKLIDDMNTFIKCTKLEYELIEQCNDKCNDECKKINLEDKCDI